MRSRPDPVRVRLESGATAFLDLSVTRNGRGGIAMLLERLLENLVLDVDAFATCRVASGWRLRLPALDWVTFHYVVQGEGVVVSDSRQAFALPPGSLAVVPPHRVHVLQYGGPPFAEATAGPRGRSVPTLGDHNAGPAEDDGLVIVCGRVTVSYAGGMGLFDHLGEVLVLDFAEDESMDATFQRMLEEIRVDRPGSRAMTSVLMNECLIGVLRTLCIHEDCRIPWLRALDDPALSRALEAMLSHPERHHSVASLAREAYLSRSAFARRFREAFGQPPLTYLRGIRLRQAARLLAKSPRLPMTAVAHRSGFSSRSQFSRAFSKAFGCSPTEFREKGLSGSAVTE